MKPTILFREESYAIMGACFEVYKRKGCGFTEPMYQERLEIELELQRIPFVAQKSIALEYRGRPLKHRFQPDFVCYEKIVLEIKAVSSLTDEHQAQVLNYLSATGHQLGLLVNFGHHPRVEYERILARPKPEAD